MSSLLVAIQGIEKKFFCMGWMDVMFWTLFCELLSSHWKPPIEEK